MARTSTYFNWMDALAQEDGLFQDLVDEQIEIYGLDLKYLPRTNLNYDDLLGESSKAAFNQAINIPMYVKSYDGYDQGAQMLTKFGVRSSEELTLVLSQRVWRDEIVQAVEDGYAQAGDYFITDTDGLILSTQQGLLINFNNDEVGELDPKEGQTIARAKEGDLVYNPLDDSVYEIKQVVFDIPFFQLGSNYTFELICEKFEYAGEIFDTGIPDIDDTGEDSSYYFTQVTMNSGGSGDFEVGEQVALYNVNGITTPTLDIPDPIVPFLIDAESGIPRQENFLTGVVVSWDSAASILVLKELDMGTPTQPDSGNDITADLLDNVLVVGLKTFASWLSSNSDQKDVPFTQNNEFQNELDAIKIVDADDPNPFGFF